MKFKLTPFIKTTYFLSVVKTEGNGVRIRDRIAFDPTVEYDTNDFLEVPNLDTLVKTTVAYPPYSQNLIKQLEETGATYSLNGCKSCGGAYRTVRLQIFEVIEE